MLRLYSTDSLSLPRLWRRAFPSGASWDEMVQSRVIVGKGPGGGSMEGSACQPHTGDFEALGFLFDSSVDSLLDARPPEVVNENRFLPSGRQFQVVPLMTRGGRGEESTTCGQGSQAQRGGEVGTWGLYPSGCQAGEETDHEACSQGSRRGVIRGFLCTGCSQWERGRNTCQALQS